MDKAELVQIFNALAHPVRLEIFIIICKQGAFFNEDTKVPLNRNTVSGLAKLVKIKQPTISHHVKILQNAGLIKVIRKGSFEYLFVEETVLDQLSEYINPKNLIKTGKIRIGTVLKQAIELSTFEKLIEYLELNNLKKVHLTTVTQSYGSVVVYLQLTESTDSIVEVIYTAVTGELLIRTTVSNEITYADSVTELIKLINSFLKIQNS